MALRCSQEVFDTQLVSPLVWLLQEYRSEVQNACRRFHELDHDRPDALDVGQGSFGRENFSLENRPCYVSYATRSASPLDFECYEIYKSWSFRFGSGGRCCC